MRSLNKNDFLAIILIFKDYLNCNFIKKRFNFTLLLKKNIHDEFKNF